MVPLVVLCFDHLHQVAYLQVFPPGDHFSSLRITAMVLQVSLGITDRAHPGIGVHQARFLHDVVDPASTVSHDAFPVVDKLPFNGRNEPPPPVIAVVIKPAVFIAAPIAAIEPVHTAAAMVVRSPYGIDPHDVFGDLLEFPRGLHFRIPAVPLCKYAPERANIVARTAPGCHESFKRMVVKIVHVLFHDRFRLCGKPMPRLCIPSCVGGISR